MKAKWLAVALLFVIAAHARAQLGELYDDNVIERTARTEPRNALSAAEGQWMAFKICFQVDFG